MAIDKKLQIFDDEGNPVDYDILASDVKFNDGKDLPTKLAEMEDEIGEGGYTPPAGGIPKTDLAPSVQQTLDDVANKVNKETGKGLSTNDYTTEEKTKLAGLPTNPVQSISVNGTAQQKDTNGNVNIEVQGGDKVSVIQPDPADGTFTIRVGSDDFTVNLNHTHENMAKLIVCEESDLPSTLDNSTIYAITVSGETEIEKLIIRGMEFAGGGVPDTGEPMISSPSNGSTINLGTNEGSGVSKTITVKGKNLTGDLTVAVGTGLTISYGQSTGQSSVTIPMAQALLGAQVTIAYSGSGALADGSLVIRQGNDVLSSVVVVVKAWEEIDLSDTSLQVNYWPGGDYMVYDPSSEAFKVSCLIDASGLSQLKITANNDKPNAFFVFLKTALPASTNVGLPYASYACTGETGRRSQPQGTTGTYALPNDCAYILVGMISNGGTGGTQYTPEYVGVK